MEWRYRSSVSCAIGVAQRDEWTWRWMRAPCLLTLVPCLWAPNYLEICKLLADSSDDFHLNTQQPPACSYVHQSRGITASSPFVRNRYLNRNCFLSYAPGYSHRSWDRICLGSRSTLQAAPEAPSVNRMGGRMQAFMKGDNPVPASPRASQTPAPSDCLPKLLKSSHVQSTT